VSAASSHEGDAVAVGEIDDDGHVDLAVECLVDLLEEAMRVAPWRYDRERADRAIGRVAVSCLSPSVWLRLSSAAGKWTPPCSFGGKG
jgi:hypothetical protein